MKSICRKRLEFFSLKLIHKKRVYKHASNLTSLFQGVEEATEAKKHISYNKTVQEIMHNSKSFAARIEKKGKGNSSLRWKNPIDVLMISS